MNVHENSAIQDRVTVSQSRLVLNNKTTQTSPHNHIQFKFKTLYNIFFLNFNITRKTTTTFI